MAGIGAGQDQDIGTSRPGIRRRTNAVIGLFPADHRLARCMTTAFRGHLVFDHHGRTARLGKTLYRAPNIHRIAIARIPIANQRNGDRIRDIARLIQHFAIAHQPQIGCADA